MPSRSAVAGLRVFSRASHGEEGRHSTPERELHGNFGLPCANLLKAEQLEENPAVRLLYSNLKLTQANLLILKRGC